MRWSSVGKRIYKKNKFFSVFMSKYTLSALMLKSVPCELNNQNITEYNRHEGFAELCVYNARHSLAEYTKHDSPKMSWIQHSPHLYYNAISWTFSCFLLNFKMNQVGITIKNYIRARPNWPEFSKLSQNRPIIGFYFEIVRQFRTKRTKTDEKYSSLP